MSLFVSLSPFADLLRTDARRDFRQLVHPSARLFAGSEWKEKFGGSIAQQLKKKNVQIIYNAKVDRTDLQSGAVPRQQFTLSNGEEVEADFVFCGFGWSPNSELVESLDPALVNERKFVRVKPTLQLKSAATSYDHIFAAGDVNDVAVRLFSSPFPSPLSAQPPLPGPSH